MDTYCKWLPMGNKAAWIASTDAISPKWFGREEPHQIITYDAFNMAESFLTQPL